MCTLSIYVESRHCSRRNLSAFNQCRLFIPRKFIIILLHLALPPTCQIFVDLGCGHGEVLLAAHGACPKSTCSVKDDLTGKV